MRLPSAELLDTHRSVFSQYQVEVHDMQPAHEQPQNQIGKTHRNFGDYHSAPLVLTHRPKLNLTDSPAVSYTHLDVYKRQAHADAFAVVSDSECL